MLVLAGFPIEPTVGVSDFLLSLEQLLALDEELERGEAGCELPAPESAVATLLLAEAEDVIEIVESDEAEDVNGGFSNVKREDDVGPADMGLATVGENLERKSR